MCHTKSNPVKILMINTNITIKFYHAPKVVFINKNPVKHFLNSVHKHLAVSLYLMPKYYTIYQLTSPLLSLHGMLKAIISQTHNKQTNQIKI